MSSQGDNLVPIAAGVVVGAGILFLLYKMYATDNKPKPTSLCVCANEVYPTMWKKNLPKLNDADNVCDCAEEAERRKRLAAGQEQVIEERGWRTYLSAGNLSNAWLPILGISALVLSLFGLWYKMFPRKKCRKPASTGPFCGSAHNVVKAEENSSVLPLCPCEVKLNAKKRKWPLDDTKK